MHPATAPGPTGHHEATRPARRPDVEPRWRRMLAPAGVIGGLGLAVSALHLRDPHVSGSWGVCPSALLGFWCPGCGGLRAVNDATHLRLDEAASSNLALAVAAPVVVFLLARWGLDRWRGRVRTQPVRHPILLLWVVLGGLAVFTVLRNLSFGGWLAP